MGARLSRHSPAEPSDAGHQVERHPRRRAQGCRLDATRRRSKLAADCVYVAEDEEADSTRLSGMLAARAA